MYLQKEKLQHINSITHEGKVVVFATDADGKISYTVKQDGFEDSYLNTAPDQRTGWESWKPLEFPNQANDPSVIDKEIAQLTHQKDTSKFILRSRYKTENESAVAPVQVISALGHIYVFRQSRSNTLLVDRFVLDGMTNKLNRKLEVRFKRSKQKHTPTKNMNKGSNGLVNIDSLDFRDANGNFFYEPTTELCLVNNLENGWFSVVLVPTIENDVYRWHIFAYNSQIQKVELTTIRASGEGLFDVQDYTIFEEENQTLVPRRIPGIIKRTLDINGVAVTNGLSATKYDLQQTQQTQSGEEQLLKTATKLMLAVPTDKGTAAFSFAIAGDGTLAEIDDTPDSTIIRSRQREVLLPLNTLDEIKAIGDRTPPPQGIITGFVEGTDEEEIEDLVKILTDGKAAELANGDLIKITGTRDYQGLYQTQKIDENTFDISLPSGNGLGYWEKEDLEEGGLIFDGMITSYQKTADGKLRVTCPNHGLENGDEVQITGTEDYNNTYPVQKIDDTHFVIERKWATGETINVKLVSQKRRGVVFDGIDNYVSLPDMNPDFSQGITVEAWVWYDSFKNWSRIIDFGNGSDADNIIFFNEESSNTLRLQINRQSTGQGMSAPGVLETGKWIHLAATIDGSGIAKLYKNGEQIQTGEIHLPNTLKRTKNYIARSNGSNDGYFNGKISDFRIWKVARTAADIKNNMYLQLTGKEVGLEGYWRLGAIAEGKVVDFSVKCNDGIVHGDVYVSAATLNRKLAGGTDAVKYSNSELFAVSERATYEESFEFKINSANPVDLAYLDNADGKNLGTKIFSLSYWGKSSRSAEEKKNIAPAQIKQDKFEDLGKGWYRVCCNVTIPDGVSLLRSFEIANVQGNWLSLEIRKHRIRLLSDSITEAKFTDSVTLKTLADNQVPLTTKLQQLEAHEAQEASLIKEKRELEAKLEGLKNLEQTRKDFEALNQLVTSLNNQVIQLEQGYNNEKNSPFNYYCYFVCRANEGARIQIVLRDNISDVLRGSSTYNAELQAHPVSDWQLWKFIKEADGFYSVCVKALGDNQALSICGRDNNVLNIEMRSMSSSDEARWKFIPGVNGYYYIYLKSRGEGARIVNTGRNINNLELRSNYGEWWSQWKLVSTGERTNSNIETAYQNWQDKVKQLQGKAIELEILRSVLNAGETQKKGWEDRLKEVISQLTKIQTELNTLNTDFLNQIKNIQAQPQTMPQVSKDAKGLVTQGALLGFVQAASRLNAIETCEGNVQLSYFDTQGRMRQTHYDATADARNSTFEQWIPNAERACLNLGNSNSVVNLEKPLALKINWSIEAWFLYPLPTTEEWNTLIKGPDGDHHIVIKNGKQLGIYLQQSFYDSGFNLDLLSLGWHHLTAVGRGDTTLFYMDGKKVGDIKAKAVADAEDNLKKTPNDATAKKKVEDIKQSILKATSDVYAIGNNHLSLSKPIDYSVMNFDGVNDRISIVDHPSLQITTYTVEVWIKPNGIPNEEWKGIIGKPGRNFNIWLNRSGFIHHRFHTPSSISAGAPDTPSGAITWNQWNHVVITNDGTTAKTYINGELKAEGPTGGSLLVDKTPLYIGCHLDNGAGNYFNGQIADVRIWNKARTQAEIKADMFKRLSGKKANLIAYYPLNEIQVEGATRKVLNLANNNHGTVIEANIVNDPTLYITPLIRSEQFGKLAEVRIWGVALSDDEIAVNSTMLLSGNEPGLLAYYPLSEATGVEVRDYSGNGNNGTVSGANWWGCTAPIGNPGTVDDNTLPIGGDALVCNDYSSVTVESNTKRKVALMRRFFAYPTTNGATLLPDKRIEALELKWIGNAQFAPTLLGYIEGAPPVPSENLTVEYNNVDDYNNATSVELTMSEDVAFSWNRSQDSGLGGNAETYIGVDAEASAGGFGFTSKIVGVRAGFKGSFDFSYQFQNQSNITSCSSLSMTDKLELHGDYEKEPKFPHLGKRFIPKNIGYALVVSALADVFVTRLARSGKMVGYQVQPVDGIPPDVNTITFLMNRAYIMNGSLDGMTGSSATSDRFFKHVPEMRSQYGSLYPASYYRLQEAYDLKRQIEAEDKRRESYFSNFDVRLVDETSLNRNIDSGDAPSTIGLQREEDKPNTQMSEEEKKKAEKEKTETLKAEAAAATEEKKTATQQKQKEIQSKIGDQEKRVQATESFAGWQKRMEDLQIRAGKRNIVNTYVWDADGGLRTEAQSFANTVEHTIGGSFNMNAGLGYEGKSAGGGVAAELTAQATVNLTQTMSKTESRSKGFQLNVDLSGVEFRGITDYNDNPILPGEKVDRYRFMSFYLEGSTQNFQDFFSYVVDPEWLRSNDEEARALRQAQAGKPNKAWRVLHRVTYVERPALMGFGRDVRKLKAAATTSENQQLLGKIAKLEESNRKLEEKLDKILDALKAQK